MNPARSFWKSIEIYITKPHVVNKRVSGVIHMGYAELPPSATTTSDFVNALAGQKTSESIQRCNQDVVDHNLDVVINNIAIKLPVHDTTETNEFIQTFSTADQPESRRVVVINKLLSKNAKMFENNWELVVLDFDGLSATFICIPNAISNGESTANRFCSAAHLGTYRIGFADNTINTEFDDVNAEVAKHPTVHWLQTGLLPKLKNWAARTDEVEQNAATQRSIESHCLLDDAEAYINLYNELKIKYGQEMVAVGSDE